MRAAGARCGSAAKGRTLGAKEPAEKLGKYTLERRIATGGMAEVFLATDDSGSRCAIKRMLPHLLTDKHFAQMFLDEAKLAVQLNHPSIAQIYDFGQDRGVLYLAMEWVDGTNLYAIVRDFASRAAQIPVEYCARLIAQTAIALGYAHQAVGLDRKPLKMIHRDVSPQNIVLGSSGAVKLIDFGVAKATSAAQKTAAGMIKGKFAYMSPEQLRGNPLDGRSDIYGLGMVLYELLATERAVPGSSEAEIAQNALKRSFPPIENKRSDVPAALQQIVARALAKDREERFATGEDLAAALEAFIASRMPTLADADLARLLPNGSAPPGARHDSHGVPTLRVRSSVPRPQIAHRALVSTPYEPVNKTVINPPGPAPESRQAEPSDVLIDPPRSSLRWFIVAMALGFCLAAVGWWILQKS